jgi:Phosphoesterase family
MADAAAALMHLSFPHTTARIRGHKGGLTMTAHIDLRRLEAMMARRALAVTCAALVLAGCGASAMTAAPPLPPASALPRSASSHVVVIVMENEEAGAVPGASDAPYLNALARRYAVATNSYAIRHPSLPNYLALTSGSTHGITSDCTDCHVGGRNIVDQLEPAHLTWKGYMEDLPRPCSSVAGAGGYAKKHDPFMSQASSPGCCASWVPTGSSWSPGTRAPPTPDAAWTPTAGGSPPSSQAPTCDAALAALAPSTTTACCERWRTPSGCRR